MEDNIITIKVLEMIEEDMKNDARDFDGKPFDGKTVAEYFANQGAAIATLANIIKTILENEEILEEIKRQDFLNKTRCRCILGGIDKER